MKCRAAEETAARARAMLQCSSTKQTPLKRKTTSDGKETIPVKKAKTDQDIIPDPKEDAILIPPSPLKKQKKLTKKAIVSLDPLPVQKTQTDRDIIPGAKEDMILSPPSPLKRQKKLTKKASDVKEHVPVTEAKTDQDINPGPMEDIYLSVSLDNILFHNHIVSRLSSW
ncbi:uncharacterized protein LOC128551857 [Mercenaria mercenaria]|uniref:uncharacterized protein LOC128551857 n=1 Tax=Mercenaria mercenaria TaxID=6596 RepID=UPI00234EC6AF|nr:uncharacterized protein LOC128551857 [Mercenaria mercenaria]